MERRANLRHEGRGTQVREAGRLKHQQQQNAVSCGTVTRALSGYAPVATFPRCPPAYSISFMSCHVKRKQRRRLTVFKVTLATFSALFFPP